MSRVRHVAIEVSLILAAIFVVDASVTLIRRIVRKDRWFEAHRTHAYQHLARRWRSHRRITIVVSAINIGWLLPWAFAAATYPNYAILFVGLAFSPLIVLALIVGAGAP